jgi:hypothetical protein
MSELNKAVKLLFIFASLLTLTGCATIFGNNTRAVRVDSNPAGAEIFVDNQRYGVTPAVITLPNYIYGGKSVTLKKEGYHEQTMMLNSQFQPCALFDILFWPGFLIDGATGNIVKIDPANLNLYSTLQQKETK